MIRTCGKLSVIVVLGFIFALIPFSQALALNSWTEGFAGTGEKTLDMYFVLEGTKTQQVMVYGLGPTLADFGKTGLLADPRIILWRLNNDGKLQRVSTNNNWKTHSSADDVASALESFNTTIKFKEAAMVVRLQPATYKLGVRGNKGTTGFAAAGAVTWSGGSGSGGGGGGITPGKWDGGTQDYGVCLNVASDGSKLTSRGSPCKDGDSFRIDFDDGLNGDCGDDDGYMNISGDISIVNNKFTKVIKNVTGGWGPSIDLKITGTFSGNIVSGVFTKTIFGGECTGIWEASPRP